MVSEEFRNIIEEDIVKCENEIKNGNKQSTGELHNRLVSKYGKIIDGFSEDLNSLFYDESGKYRKANLETMRQKLLLFKAMGYKNNYADKEGKVVVNNVNQMEVKMNITFADAKKTIENMSALQDEEITEIIQKIDELEKIVMSKERKTKKWAQAKDIIKWIADKGVDVGITLLPLLMQIGQ